MSKIIKYKDETYDFETLIIMSKDKNFNKHMDLENDEVELLDTGETIKLKDINIESYNRGINIKENTKHLSKYHQNRINKILNDDLINLDKKSLWIKFKENTITLEELEMLLLFESKDVKNNTLGVSYKNGFYVNKIKDKPIGLSDDYYGKFFRLLHLINYGNTIRHNNSNPIKKKDIYEFLGMKSDRTFDTFIRKLKNYTMVAKIEKEFKGKIINYLIINPAYASANVRIDTTIYKLFKEDLDEILSELEIKYLEMLNSENSNSMIAYE